MKITAEEQQQLRDGKVIFLNDMVNRKGEEFSSFIKADLETGRLSYSARRTVSNSARISRFLPRYGTWS